MKKNKILLVFFVFLLNISILAQERFIKTIEYYNDTTLKLQFEEIQNKEFTANNITNSNERDIKNIWVKFYFSDSVKLNNIILKTLSIYDSVILYTPKEEGGYIIQKTGFKIPYLNRPLIDHDLSIATEVIKSKPYYLKFHTKQKNGITFYVNPIQKFINERTEQLLFYGIFFGIIFIVFFYSLIFYLRLKESTYLYYSLYVFCFGIFCAMLWGILSIFQFISFLGWNRDLYTIPFAGMTCFLLLYARQFLDTKNKAPFFHKLLSILIIGRILLYLGGLLFNINFFYSQINDDIFLIGAFSAGIYRLRQGYKPARYYLFAFSVTYIGFLAHAFPFLNNIVNFPYSPFSFLNANLTEIILFSFGLAERFRILRKEKETSDKNTILYLTENLELKDKLIFQLNENELLKDKVNRELEEKVAERTRELASLNALLKAQSEEIEKMNLLLEKDNTDLKKDVDKISKDRILLKNISFEEFKNSYPDDDACMAFVEQLKYKNGFKCKKCGNLKYSKGNTPFSRRCSKCNHIERIFTDTIYSGLKFPILKAFYLTYIVSSGKKVTIYQLSEELDLRKQTCWAFQKRMQEIITTKKGKLKNKDGWSHLIMIEQ